MSSELKWPTIINDKVKEKSINTKSKRKNANFKGKNNK